MQGGQAPRSIALATMKRGDLADQLVWWNARPAGR